MSVSIAEDNLQLLILLARVTSVSHHTSLCGTVHQTQGLMHAKQALDQVSYIDSPVVKET